MSLERNLVFEVEPLGLKFSEENIRQLWLDPGHHISLQ